VITKADFAESLTFVQIALDGFELLRGKRILARDVASKRSTRRRADVLDLF
jgi:hypothetical protein